MTAGARVPGVVVAWGASLLVGAGTLAVLPPEFAARLAWPAFLASPLAAVVVDQWGFERTRLSAFAAAAFGVGVSFRTAIEAGALTVVASPAAATRLRVGLPLLVLLVARSLTRRLLTRQTG